MHHIKLTLIIFLEIFYSVILWIKNCLKLSGICKWYEEGLNIFIFKVQRTSKDLNKNMMQLTVLTGHDESRCETVCPGWDASPLLGIQNTLYCMSEL